MKPPKAHTLWRNLPFLRFLIPLILGVVCADTPFFERFTDSNTLVVVAVLGFIFLVFFAWRNLSFAYRWLWGIPLSMVIFCLGAFRTQMHSELNKENHFKNVLAVSQPQENTTHLPFFLGIVQEVLPRSDAGFRLRLRIKGVQLGDTFLMRNGNLLLYVRGDSNMTQALPKFGSTVAFQVNPHFIEAAANPHSFNFQTYWHHQNIHYQGFIESKAFKVLKEASSENWLLTQAQAVQAYFLETLRLNIGAEREFAVAAALLLGWKGALDKELKTAYVETGAIHILAISGMHIVLIFNSLEYFVKRIRWKNYKAALPKLAVLIAFIFFYALLTGFSASVVRAALMSGLLSLGKYMNRRADTYNLLSASAFMLLLYDPYWVFDVGFQLSYAAVAGLYFFAPRIQALLFIENPFLLKIWEGLAVGLAAQLTVTPLSLYYFHQFPTYFWLTGILAVPVSEWAMYVGLLLFSCSAFKPVAFVLGKLVFALIWLLNETVLAVSKLPFGLIENIWLWGFEVAVGYIAILGIAAALQTRKLRWLYVPLSMAGLLGLFSGFKVVEMQENRQIVVYKIPKAAWVETYIGNTAFVVSRTKVSKKYTYSDIKQPTSTPKDTFLNTRNEMTRNHRTALRITAVTNIDNDSCFQNQHFFYCKSVVVASGFKLLLLDKPLSNETLSADKFSFDAVLLLNNPAVDISTLCKRLHFKHLVFDSTNAPWRTEKWKSACRALGIGFHDVAQMGAWVHTIE
jgi:competence protein ComEC